MPRRPLSWLFAALVLAFGLACGGLDPEALEQALEGEPPPDAAWVGTWQGGDDDVSYTLTLDPLGMADLRTVRGGSTTNMNAPVKAWTETGFEIGIFSMRQAYEVQQPPHRIDDGAWRMVFEGVVLERIGGDEGLDSDL